MNKFNIEKIIKKVGEILFPKEVLIGIGIMIFVIFIVFMTNNIYVEEMLMMEGVMKSTPIYTEEELREYGEIYKELESKFINEIGVCVKSHANRTNRAGEEIYYGIYNKEYHQYNKELIYPHENGENVNRADSEEGEEYKSKYDDSYNNYPYEGEWSTFIETDEYKEGVKIKYEKTEGREEGESNFRDILTVVSMMLDQKQTKEREEKEIKKKVPEMIKTLFNMSHTYRGESKDLYPCEKGCRVLFYYCNEEDSGYKGTGIDLRPFEIIGHEELEDYSVEDFEVISPEGECEICEHNGKGCEEDEAKCYHGKEDEEKGKHYLGRGTTKSFEMECENSREEKDCKHECGESCEEECKHECDESCYDSYCEGHSHYNCRGHYYVCCMGHTDIEITIKIMYAEEMIKNLQ